MRWPNVVALLWLAALVPFQQAIAQTTGTLSGAVTAEGSRQPVPGARVSVEGTQLSAATGADGRYTLNGIAPGSYRVTVVAAGYGISGASGVAIAAGQTRTLNFEIQAQGAVQLEGVVAVGYGTQRRKDVTGSVASINAEDVRAAPGAGVEQLMQGQAPGVQVIQANGAPGGAVSVRIRGTNSITANSEPLYVIDGVPAFVGSNDRGGSQGLPLNPMADFSPNDIESIEILKDASATAIYGSRGANGVVLVTTKRGRRGESRIQWESTYGTQEVTRTIPMLNAREFAELKNEGLINANRAPYFTAAEVASFAEGTYWQEEIFRSAPVQSHAATISGGDEKTRYLLTGSMLDQDGIIIGSDFRRYSARINLDREVSRKFRLGNSLSVSHTQADVVQTDASWNADGVVTASFTGFPTKPVRDAEGKYTLFIHEIGVANPVATALEVRNDRSSYRLLGSFFGEYDLTDALRFRSSLGGNIDFERREYYAPKTTLEGFSLSGDASVSSSQATQILNENILTYRRALRDGHDVDLLGGFTVQTSRSEFMGAGAQGFATDVTGADNLGAGALPLSSRSGVNEWALLSWLGRANYNLLGRYLLTFTARADGSSKFGANHKWGIFPSAAFAWRLSEEPFLKGIESLDDAKLRLSYGVTGNQEIGTYTSLARLQDESYVYGKRVITTYAPAGLAPNPDLRWEQTRQFNGGLDLAFFDSRLALTGDAYVSRTENLLLLKPLPTYNGYANQMQNVGSVANRGVELGLTTVNVDGDRFSWRTNVNASVNRNEVIELGDVDQIFLTSRTNIEGGASHVLQVGQPLGTFVGFRTEGIWQTGDDFSKAPTGSVPGEYRYVDQNQDGQINAADRTILGYADPDWTAGLTNNFGFGPLTLDVFLRGVFGNEVLNGLAVTHRRGRFGNNEFAVMADRWTPTNPSDKYPRANLSRPNRLLDQVVEDGSHIRLQNVTLGYRLPDGVVPRVDQGRVYVSGQNLHTWTRYTGFDPEVSSYGGDPGMRGTDLGMYPRSRTVSVGINLTF